MKKMYTPFIILIAVLFFFTPQTSHAQTRLADSTALVAIYNGNGGTGWVNSTSWLTAQPLETWYGIHTSASGRVDSISLSGNNLVNSFPQSLAFMDALAGLDLSHNNLTDAMPYFQTPSMVIFNVSFNQITGPVSFYNMPNVVVMRVNNNQLQTGCGALGLFPLIRDIYASHNSFTDVLPAFDGTTYDTIDLSYNQLTGSVGYFNYPVNAKYFNISHNNLSGAWVAYGGFTSTAFLDVTYNKYTFNELEPLFPNSLPINRAYAPQDTLLPVHFHNGKLAVTAGGTLGNNTYVWYKDAIPMATITGDSTYKPAVAGNYSVAVTNAVVAGLTLNSNTLYATPFSVITSVTPVSNCGTGSDGVIYVTASGGVAPYTFVLSIPGGGTTTQINNGKFSNLAPGSYTVNVTDNEGNNVSAAGIAVIKAAAITLTPYALPVSGCGNSGGGTISAGRAGGVWPFVYVLSGTGGVIASQTNNETFGGLAPGTYSLAVTDAAGCPGAASGITVAQAAPLEVTPSTTPVSNCGAVADGIVYAGNTGGVYPKEFTLTYPDGTTLTQRNDGKFVGLATGTYGVTVTDTTGCTTTATGAILAQAAPITLAPYVLPVSGCGNGGGGTINAGRTGGVWPFVYTLTGPGGATPPQTGNETFGGLAPGTYSITVTDLDGCTLTAAGITVAQAAPLVLTPSTSPVSNCGAIADGIIYAGNTGGVYPKEFTLTYPDATTLTQRNDGMFGGLAAGTYGITITDATGCTAKATGIVLADAAPLTLSPSITPTTSCNYNNNENLNAGTHGGAAPYSYTLAYSYNNTVFLTQGSGVFNNLNGGTYNLTVTDAGGCTASANNVTVPEGPHPAFAGTSSQVPSCTTATDGSITVSLTGGAPPYLFFLEDNNYNPITSMTGTSATFTGLAAADYIVTASDANTCGAGYDDFSLTTTTPCSSPESTGGLTPPSVKDAAKGAGIFAVQILPNPSTTTFTLAVSSAKTDAVEITVTDMYGRTVHHAEGVANRQYTFGGNFAAGMYIARVMQGNEVKTVKVIKQ